MSIDPRNFLFNSDYEIDQIVFLKEGKIDSNTTELYIDTGLNFPILPFGVWSKTEDFTEPHTFTNAAPRQFVGLGILDESVSSTLIDRQVLLTTYLNSPTNIYYRLYGLMPNNVNQNAPATAAKAKAFIFNTDYNYRKLFKKACVPYNVTWASSGAPTVETITIDHNLGYKPQVMVWAEAKMSNNKDYIEPVGWGSFAHNEMDLVTSTVYAMPAEITEVTDAQVIIHPPAGPQFFHDKKIHYRIYYDEAE